MRVYKVHVVRKGIRRVHLLAALLFVVSNFAAVHYGFQKGEQMHGTVIIELKRPKVLEKQWANWGKWPHQRNENQRRFTQRSYTKDEKHCLALNIFFEARDQNIVGKVGVGFALLNRSKDKRWPTHLCEVATDTRHGCQFSWTCDGKPDRPNKDHPMELMRWEEAKRIAAILTAPLLSIEDPTKGSVFYISTVAARKKRIEQFDRLYAYNVTLDDHRFYE